MRANEFINEVTVLTVSEDSNKNLQSELADVYRKLAPGIKQYKDKEGANRLYNELLAIAKQHGAAGVREFNIMLNSAQRRAHLEYDTNPGGFENWFWFLPFDN